MIRDRFGPTYSAPILLYSIPFGEFSKQERLADKGDWAPLRATMVDAAKRLEAGGADFIIVASNTMNSTDDLIEANVGIPVLNIVDAVGGAVQDRGLKTIALLGTKYTMEQEFYRGRLEGDYGLKVVTPDAAERDYINDVIFNELCAGVFKPQSRRRFEQIVDRLVKEEGAEGVILGCTEIPLLMRDADTLRADLRHDAAARRRRGELLAGGVSRALRTQRGGGRRRGVKARSQAGVRPTIRLAAVVPERMAPSTWRPRPRSSRRRPSVECASLRPLARRDGSGCSRPAP